MAIYEKNLTEDFRLRLSKTDMDFLKALSKERGINVSECVRSIIGEYRRANDAMKTLNAAIKLVNEKGGLSDGDTKTDFYNLV